MSVSSLSAARLVCEVRDWKVSNLELQKILYIAHMIYLGNVGEPLIDENFEAWDYGPVIPELYQKVKGFGAKPVGNVFHSVDLPSESTKEYSYIRRAADVAKGMTAGQLVSFTHRPYGAWSRFYKPGLRDNIILNEIILDEYNEWKRSRAK
jgi:uncharacterized phage-associated protein